MACSSEFFEHDADHCEADKGGDGCRVAFEITCEPTISADPCECPFNDPTLGHDNEAVEIGAFDDFDFPASCGRDGSRELWSLISSVSEDFFDEGKPPPRASQQSLSAVAILNVGGQNAYAKEETEGVDEHMTLAARNLFSRVEPLRINRCAPF